MQSYSQNLEDVLLNRCFKDQKSGTYVDVGAGPGDGYSVTRNLYLQGWSGLLIEPISEYAEVHRKFRPRDKVIDVVIGSENCEVEFIHFLRTGLSTKKSNVTASLKDLHSHETLILPQVTLQSILDSHGVNQVDLLKIDVEGSEMDVLLGLDFNQHQPRLIIVEATRPMTRIRVSDKIRKYLLSLGYEFALFDGLNDYFVFRGERQLMDALDSPVNVFDGEFFKISQDIDSQGRIYELEIKNLILETESIQVRAEKEKLELKINEQSKIIEGHQNHLYSLDNSVRMKIGTFVVKLLLPFRPITIKLLKAWHLFKKSVFLRTNRHIRKLARILLRLRLIRIITTYIRVTRLRFLGFWGWKNLRVQLKNFISFTRAISERNLRPFDAEFIQVMAGASKLGFQGIQTHAWRTFERDLDKLDVKPFSPDSPLSEIIVDVRCIQEPGLATRGIGKHANFIINEILLWAKELNLEVKFLRLPETEVPNFFKSFFVINVLPENTDSILYIQLSSMTENPITSLPILLNSNSYKIGVFYDFIPKHNPGYYLFAPYGKALYKANLSTLKFYDEFWAISNSVADELRSHLRKFGSHKAKVIPTGVSAKIPVIQRVPLNANRADVLIPTGGDARKDPLTALAALVVAKRNDSIEKIVVIGHLPPIAIGELKSVVRGTWVAPKLEFLAPNTFDDIALAYSKAMLTLVTSLDEGYSLPIVESISMKVPVLGSSIPAHKELLQKKYLFKPKSYLRGARKIQLALRTNQFTVPSDYLNTSHLLVPENLIPGRLSTLKSSLVISPGSKISNKGNTHKPIKVVSPWPPLNSGVADYSESTLRDSKFDIVCSDAIDTKKPELSRWNWCEIANSRRLFVLGNNHAFHSSATYVLLKMGGNALIHDTRILDMWSNLFGTASYNYIDSFKPISRDDFARSFMNLDDAKTLGFEPLIPSVHLFITHSTMLNEHLKSIGAKKVDYVPFASRIPNITPLKPKWNGQSEFVIGVFGRMDIKTKHFDMIYQACEDLVVDFPNLRLVCVGELLTDSNNFLDEDNRRNRSWLQLKGKVEDSEYWETLANCNMTIHVRKIKRLNLSGAVMDSLAVGTPVLCSETILSEMQIPLGLPFSDSIKNDATLAELKTVIKKMIQLKAESHPETLMNFAKSRDNVSYIQELKLALN